MERTPNLHAIHTYVRDKSVDNDTFLFALERLVNLVVQFALVYVRYHPTDVVTPTDSTFHGAKLDTCISVVTITRTGDIFETAIRNHIPISSYGKIVIHQESRSSMKQGPRLYYAKLSPDIKDPNSTVLLFDGVLSTGNAVNMAIQVLLDHGVRQENIMLVCLVAAPDGLYRLVTFYPKITIIVSWVDDSIDHRGYAVPGIGYLGDRYFGTPIQ
uniref:uracil phosphoribosyltransferase n=1 Tax=Lygus hesperus TaxID=30085 RepID=A0A0A9VQG4_LYGHE